jgi:uncharacterized phage infection (PIP) family protein YhgE
MVKDILIKLGLTSGDFKKGLNEAGNAADDFSKKTDKASKSTKSLLDAGEEMPGVMGKAASGIKGLIGSVKTLTTAFLANPIGIAIAAIAVAAASLYAIFKDFAPLVDFISDKFARLQGAFKGLQTAVYNFTQGLGFSTKGIKDQADAAERASAMLRVYEDSLSSFNLKQAQYEAQIDKLIKQAKNKSISDKEANELIKEATRLQNLQIESLKENQKQETAFLVERAKAAGATYQQILAIQKGASVASLNISSKTLENELDALQQNYKKRVEAVGSLEEKREKINNAQAALDEKRKAKAEKAEADRIKASEEEKARLDKQSKDNEDRYKAEIARLAEIEKNEKERKRSLIESEREEYAANIADLKAIKDDDLLADQERFAAIEELEAKGVLTAREAADAKVKIAEAESNAKMQILQGYSQLLMSISNLAGRETAAGKALAVAATTIDTYVAAFRAYKEGFKLDPTGTFSLISAAAAAATGIAAVKNILSVKVPGGGGGGGSLPNVTAPQTRPSSGFTMLGNEDPIKTTNEGGKIKVFVTESDITNSQNKVSSIQAKATIG